MQSGVHSEGGAWGPLLSSHLLGKDSLNHLEDFAPRLAPSLILEISTFPPPPSPLEETSNYSLAIHAHFKRYAHT